MDSNKIVATKNTSELEHNVYELLKTKIYCMQKVYIPFKCKFGFKKIIKLGTSL